MKPLDKINEQNAESPAQLAAREKVNKKNLEEIKNRVERRKYNKLTEDIAGFSNKRTYNSMKDKEEYNFVMAFGFGFITLTFMGFLTGFCLGKFILEKSDEFSLVLSLITGIGTLVMEMILMIGRLQKWELKTAMDKKRYKVE